MIAGVRLVSALDTRSTAASAGCPAAKEDIIEFLVEFEVNVPEGALESEVEETYPFG
jgi:hypothetical protein